MISRYHAALLVLACGVVAACSTTRLREDLYFGTAGEDNSVALVSLHALVANSQDFDGRRVRTEGYFQHGAGYGILFLDHDSFVNQVYLNAIYLRLNVDTLHFNFDSPGMLDGNLAIVEGAFVGKSVDPPCLGYPKVDESGHPILCVHTGPDYAGSLDDVSYLVLRPFWNAL